MGNNPSLFAVKIIVMQKLFTLIFSISLTVCFCQNGTIKESLKVKSTILGEEVEYSIYLPVGYDATNRRYPVLYLLHGYTDDETGWVQFGEVNQIADKAITVGDATPMIIVMPDAKVTWYVNSYDGKVKYEDFFIKELIPHIDATYRTRPTKEFRAISGLSMGGHGSFLYATKHPEMFVACAPMSGAFWTHEEFSAMNDEFYERAFADIFGKGLKGEARSSGHFLTNNGIDIVKNGNADELKKVKYYIDCGDDDFLIEGNMALHLAMKKKEIPHEFRVRDGVHDWTYWRTALPEVLKFVSQSFHR